MKQRGVVFISVVVLLLCSLSVVAQEAMVDSKVMNNLETENETTVMILFHDSPGENQRQAFGNQMSTFEKRKQRIAHQQDMLITELNQRSRQKAVAGIGIQAVQEKTLNVTRKYATVPGMELRVDAETLDELKQNKRVKAIYAPKPVHALLSQSKHNVNASTTWRLQVSNDNITGKHQTICIIDTGIDYKHIDLGNCTATPDINDRSCGKVIGGFDYVNDDDDPIDDNGHGTHVAGIAAGNSTTYTGVAPEAKLVALKMLDELGSGNDNDLISSIDWCVNNASILNITVISMSLGGTTGFSSYCDSSDALVAAAIGAAIRNNITVIASAGNDGSSSGIKSPACIENVTAVSWATKTNAIDTSGDRNSLTDLIAPGTSITSARDPESTLGTCTPINSEYIRCSGSSMAAPHVAGAAALVHQYIRLKSGRDVEPNETQQVLNDTGYLAFDNSLQYSRINIFSAIDSFGAPAVGTVAVNNSNPYFGDVVRVNASANDSVRISHMIVSTNHSGAFVNQTQLDVNQEQTNSSLTVQINGTRNAVVGLIVYAVDTAGNSNASSIFTITSLNAEPSIVNLTVNASDPRNTTNASLEVQFAVEELDGDNITNETLWYRNGVEDTSLRNLTTISSQNTTKGEIWNVSVRVFDGFNYSTFQNTSIAILNAPPNANVTSTLVTVNETAQVNITTNASDIDADNLDIKINDSRFTKTDIFFIWNTNLSDEGTYHVNITVNDSTSVNSFDSTIVTIAVNDARDTDNDGNPDFNDTDDDNDGINDISDFVTGNLSNLNTTESLNLTINATNNFSKLFNGTFAINISNGTETIISFNFTFNQSSTFDFGSITVNKTANGTGAVSIKGVNLTSIGKTKTLFLEKKNSTVSSVCIKDTEASIADVSSYCNADDEVLLSCNNQTSNGYRCLSQNNRYIVFGLSHSAVKESCQDADGDGYGSGCALGTDCNDNNAGQTTSCSSPSSSGGGGGGGGGSGGGGGGGGSVKAKSGETKVFYYFTIDAGQKLNLSVKRDGIAFELLQFDVEEAREKVSVTIKTTNETHTLDESLSPYQFIEIEKENLEESDVQSAFISFKVNKSWLRNEDIEADELSLYRFDDGWNLLKTTKVRENRSHMWYEVVSPGLSSFVIAAPKKIVEVVEEDSVNETNRTDELSSLVTGAVVSDATIENSEIKQTSSKNKTVLLASIVIFLMILLLCYNPHDKHVHKHKKRLDRIYSKLRK